MSDAKDFQDLCSAVERLDANLRFESYRHSTGRSGWVSVSRRTVDGFKVIESWVVTEEFEGADPLPAIKKVLSRLPVFEEASDV